MRRKSTILVILSFSIFITSKSLAWIAEGHAIATSYAIELIKEKTPEFFVEGSLAVIHCSGDPDIFKVFVSSGQLNKTESPEHYIDLELLKGQKLPDNRRDFFQFCLNNNISSEKVGTLPYAVIEWTQRLTLAFAEYRKWPDNEIIQAKCLVYAGNLAHYAEDLCMPLHTTVHHDGMTDDLNTPSPRTGIHLKADALIGKVPGIADIFTKKHEEVMPFDNVWEGITNQLAYSHRLVPKIYEMKDSFPALDEPIQSDTSVADFAEQELNQTAHFTAQLFLTAWNDSESIKLPSWDHREKTESMAELSAIRN